MGSDPVGTNSNPVTSDKHNDKQESGPAAISYESSIGHFPLYVVANVRLSSDGVYEEKRDPELHFKKVGESDYFWR